MEIYKQIKTREPFEIRLNYWMKPKVVPIASFYFSVHNITFHLIVSEEYEYTLIHIVRNPNTGYDDIKTFNTIPNVVISVIKELPKKPSDAEPIEFIETIKDIQDA